MTAHNTETASEGEQTGTSLVQSSRTATMAKLAGGALIVDALRRRNERPILAILEAVVGLGLLLVGRRAGDAGTELEVAKAHRRRGDALAQPEANSRGTSGEPSVPTQRNTGRLTFSDDVESPEEEVEEMGAPQDDTEVGMADETPGETDQEGDDGSDESEEATE